MNIEQLAARNIDSVAHVAKRTIKDGISRAKSSATVESLDGIKALAAYNSIAVKKFKPMGCDKFDKLLKARNEVVSAKEREKISSIFVGNRMGESSNEIINNFLRTGKAPSNHKYWNSSTIMSRVEEIRAASRKFSLDDDYIVYRGVKNLDFLPEAGEIFTEKGFMSTSANKHTAERYSNYNGMIDILLPKGTNCNMNGSDCEILLNNGSKFKVLSKGKFFATIQLLQ